MSSVEASGLTEGISSETEILNHGAETDVLMERVGWDVVIEMQQGNEWRRQDRTGKWKMGNERTTSRGYRIKMLTKKRAALRRMDDEEKRKKKRGRRENERRRK